MVDPREIEAMANLRRIMNGEVGSAEVVAPSKGIAEASDPTSDMKAILEAFYSGQAPEAMARVQAQANESPAFREAIMTKRTPSGVQVGSWEIKVHEDRTGKLYDVVNVHTGEAIANDLALYETALGLTKLLNQHVGINSKQVRKLLTMEEDYSRFRQDAAVFKHRAKQRTEAGDSFRAAIAEDRFKENRDQAVKLREEIAAYSRTL